MLNSCLQHQIFQWLRRETVKVGVRRLVAFQGAVASDVGTVRSENQDKIAFVKINNDHGNIASLTIVSDGMGGMADGASCAALAVASVVAFLYDGLHKILIEPANLLKNAILFANETVFGKFLSNGGATVACVLGLPDGRIFWGSAGDSRIYLNNADCLKQITVDDTLAAHLKREGPIPREHTKLIQYVGMGKHFEPHIGAIEYSEGECILLVSDGVHYLSNFQMLMKNIINSSPDVGTTARRLLDVSNWAGGEDNASAAILRVPFYFDNQKLDIGGVQIWDPYGDLQIYSAPIKEGDSEKLANNGSDKAISKSSQENINKSQNSKRKSYKKKKKENNDLDGVVVEIKNGNLPL